MESASNKIKVEIWSDVMCSYCYMAKKKFDAALSDFKNASNVEIIWRSFQIAPHIKSEPGKTFYQALSEHTGMSLEAAKNASDQLTGTAKQTGLVFDFNRVVPANTFNAHRFSHWAKKNGVQNEAEEKLFKAYFTEGKNIDDVSTLVQLGVELGLNASETKSSLSSNQYADEVRKDMDRAQQEGVRSVPFYNINGKHTISGVQDQEVFLQTLEKAHAELITSSPSSPNVIDGAACEMNGECK